MAVGRLPVVANLTGFYCVYTLPPFSKNGVLPFLIYSGMSTFYKTEALHTLRYLTVCPAPQRFVFDSKEQFGLPTADFISSAFRLEGEEFIVYVSVLSTFYNSVSGPLPT